MGQGGRVVLINGTRYRWKKIHTYTYQMNAWKFPDLIEAGSSEAYYIEWNEGIFKDWSHDNGICEYLLEGSNFKFRVRAEVNDNYEYDVMIKFENFSNLGSRSIDLHWFHDGFMVFSLTGREGKFVCSQSDASDWMFKNLDLIGNQKLIDLCLPGSHNSGMSEVNWPTFFANPANSQCQELDILGQLKAGIRYFDIRPIKGSGKFHSGHYSKITGGWQGARGQSLESIINQLNNFTAFHKELIILNLSHGLNTDLGNPSYAPLNDELIQKLFNQLLEINNLFTMPKGQSVNLLDKPLNFFLNSNRSAVICIVDRSSLKMDYSFHHRGFYWSNEFSVIDEYSDTNKLDKMIEDQLDKLNSHSHEKNRAFLISWTLTLQGIENITGRRIEDMARWSNRSIHKLILGSNYRTLVRRGFPNIISQDYITSDCASIALAINLFNSN